MTALRSRTAAALLATAVVLTGCGAPGTEEGAESGAVIRIADPGNAGPLAYAKREGILEERLADVGATIEWGGSYASFTASAQALKAGELNVKDGAISPAAGFLAGSDELRIFAVKTPPDDPAPVRDGLVVPKGSPVDSVRGLKGKRVAVNKAGKGEYLLLRALEQAEGIGPGDVERVYLNPQEGASAFASGKVDAWWAIVDAYPEAVKNGARTLATGREVDKDDLGMFAARTELLERHPEAVAAFLDVLNELTAQARKDPERFQNVFLDKGPTAVRGPRLSEEVELTRLDEDYRVPTREDREAVERVASVFADDGVLDAPLKSDDVVFDLDAAQG